MRQNEQYPHLQAETRELDEHMYRYTQRAKRFVITSNQHVTENKSNLFSDFTRKDSAKKS